MPELSLNPELMDVLRGQLPAVAEHTVAAVVAEVPSYSDAFSGQMGAVIRQAVELALSGFLDRALSATRAGSPGGGVLRGAHDLGRGEARSGRSMDALLAAYRVGARVAWRDFAAAGVASGLSAATLAEFAELVFAYIDELSAASVAGHTDELAVSGRVRQRHLERLGRLLLASAPEVDLLPAAEVAGWEPPRTLTAVLVPEAGLPGLAVATDPRTLRPTDGVPDDIAVLLVPDAHGRGRAALLHSLRGRDAVVGPARPWGRVASSYTRAVRGRALGIDDTEQHLVSLVLQADPDALADLRAQALAPLADVRPTSRDKLIETLRAWLLHQGRREDVAAALFVHPQTVRYRVGQLRELYGERLTDPEQVLMLTVALGVSAR